MPAGHSRRRDGPAESLIAERLAELAGMRLLYERVLNIGPQYCLTSSLELRRLVVRLGAEWS